MNLVHSENRKVVREMAGKQKPTKLKNLFEGHRRKAFLVSWIQLCNKAGVSSLKMDLRLPLLNLALMGINTEINEPFMLMAKKESKTDRSVINIELEGMTLEIFSTDTSKERWVYSTGVKFLKFYLASTGEEDKKEVNLHLVAYMPFSKEMMEWAAIHLHKDFHLEAVYSNSEMEFGDEDPDDDSDEEGDLDPDNEENAGLAKDDDIPVETPAPTAAKPPMPRPAKNGPKDLAAYHASQKPN